MKLDLDPERLRTIMAVWRDLVEMKVPLSPGVRSQLFEQRGKHLQRFAETTANWLTVLRACSADEAAKEEFDRIVRDVEDLRKWAMGALIELKVLEIEAQSGSAS